MRHLFRVENIDRGGSNWPLGAKMCFFDPKIWIFGAKSQFFVLEPRFLSTGHITSTPQGNNFLIQTTPKKISVSELCVIFWDSPRFLAISGLCHFVIISNLNFGSWSTKLDGIVRAIRKMTHNDNGSGPGQNYGETAVFTFGRKVVFWPKILFFPKKTTEIC